MTSEYAGEFAKLPQAFGEKFQEMKSKQKELNKFVKSFNVEPADVPETTSNRKSLSCKSTMNSKLSETSLCPSSIKYTSWGFSHS